MVDSFLLEILACPESKQSLRLASAEEVTKLNEKIQQGKVYTKEKKLVKDVVEGLLVREDNKIGYPIREQIPILLVEEGIILDESIREN